MRTSLLWMPSTAVNTPRQMNSRGQQHVSRGTVVRGVAKPTERRRELGKGVGTESAACECKRKQLARQLVQGLWQDSSTAMAVHAPFLRWLPWLGRAAVSLCALATAATFARLYHSLRTLGPASRCASPAAPVQRSPRHS